MELWKIALILLVVMWLAQSVGTWIQMRHFRAVMQAINEKWSDGHLGVGNSRGRLGKGVIAILVTDPAATVRKVMVMEGRSVLAKFRPLPEHEGKSLDRLKADLGNPAPRGRAAALARAIEQLERARERSTREGTGDALPGATAAGA